MSRSEKYKLWHDDFIDYLYSKQPAVQDYQYADDFIKDSMSYYMVLCKVAHQRPKWWHKREHRLIYAHQAESYGLPYKDKAFETEILKERENDGN